MVVVSVDVLGGAHVTHSNLTGVAKLESFDVGEQLVVVELARRDILSYGRREVSDLDRLVANFMSWSHLSCLNGFFGC